MTNREQGLTALAAVLALAVIVLAVLAVRFHQEAQRATQCASVTQSSPDGTAPWLRQLMCQQGG